MAQGGLELETIDTFGELLKHLRQRARLTQDEFGLAVGYSRAHVARLESNQRAPDLSIVRARFPTALGLQHESDLAARLLTLAATARDEPVRDAETTSSPARAQVPHNLPLQVTSFVGRTAALAELKHLLAPGGTRLLTLTGAGGTGKTRLALQLAADLLDQDKSPYPGGVWLVELASLPDPAFVPQTVAAVLHVHDVHEEMGRPMPEVLVAALRTRERPLLLVLDNCEHVLEACVRLADALLRHCPLVTLVATSREGLGIAGEVSWRVPSLHTPASKLAFPLHELAGYEAVRLFVDRAKAVLPPFTLSDANGPAVQQVVTRLDGIPLAIELAAARVRALTPEKLAERLTDRFRLLIGGSRTAMPRQQTLRATIDWSYELLGEHERAVLRRLSVFAGGWSLEAAEAVCAGEGIESDGVLDLLTRLVDKSLVVMGDVDGMLRYHLLETIRQYASEKLSDTEEGTRVRDRHFDYFLQLGEEVAPLLNGTVPGDQVSLVKRLQPDMDNVWSALDWAIEAGRFDDGFRLIEALQNMWFILGEETQQLDAAQRLLARLTSDEHNRLRMRVLSWIGVLYGRQSFWDQGQAISEQVLAIAISLNDLEAQIEFYGNAVVGYLHQGNLAMVYASWEKRRAIAQAIYAAERLERDELQFQFDVAFTTDDYSRAQELYERLTLVSGVKSKSATSAVARMKGYILLHQDKWSEAGASLRESLVDNAALGDRLAVAACLAAFAALALGQADLQRAARLFGASEAVHESVPTRFLPWDQREMRRSLAALHAQLDEATLHAAWAEGRTLTYQQAMEYALAGLG
jgi:predicted ATPase